MSPPSSLAPGYLIAAPNMQDPNFAKTVVLMAEHNEEGAVGFILNKETPLSLGFFLQGVDEDLAEIAESSGCGDLPVLVGGPVQNNVAWVLYPYQEDEELDEGSMRVGDQLVLGASMDTLRAFVSGQRPGPFHVLLGYAGWGENQLEDELLQGAWLPLSLGEDLAFSYSSEECWEEGVARLGLVPGAFMMGGPGAKA
jgi:putative transcriptional regulator